MLLPEMATCLCAFSGKCIPAERAYHDMFAQSRNKGSEGQSREETGYASEGGCGFAIEYCSARTFELFEVRKFQ